ncbi:hypothetical protein RND81_13G084800 [Saponaria officinalis]|uniref:Uncharacterized protein n=1 Tax=Saponaria officinalis TaxID=3572 RepID=A0AAW1H3U8_SAPOF
MEEPEILLQFTPDEVKEELNFWKHVVYCFILGANPPWDVIEGFVYRIWAKYKIDSISFLHNGVFLVRFADEESKNGVLQQGHFLFDNKPLIVKPWVEGVELIKSSVKTVPVWGKGIPRIASLLGEYIRCDQPTEEKTRLDFARVMVEVPFGNDLPDSVKFLDEDGKPVSIKSVFEWKPILCSVCGRVGHESAICRRAKSQKKVTQQWRPKTVQPVHPVQSAPITIPVESPVNIVTDSITTSTPEESGQCSQPGSLAKKKHVKWFLHSQQLGLFGLLETKVKPSSLNDVCSNVCDGWRVSTNSQFHKGGRVWVMWRPNVFHVQPVEKLLWNRLSTLGSSIGGPWVLCGDFNAVLHPMERLGGRSSDEEMDDFRTCIEGCGFIDSPASGCYFTWNNKQGAPTRIYSRLDRFMVNQQWLDFLPNVYAHFHNEGIFDHTPCTIQTRGADVSKRSFKYFNMWSGVDDFLPCVAQTWGEYVKGTKMFSVVTRLKNLKKPLKLLNNNLFADVENNAIRAGLYLEYVQNKLRSDPLNPDWIEKETAAGKTYCELKRASDSYLLQKSKAHWVCDGDNNTTYFHSIIKGRQVRNKVLRITDIHAQICTEASQIQSAFINFYKKLLGSSSPCFHVNKTVVQNGSICTQAHWQILLKPVSESEIWNAIFSIPNYKAPGPDGYSSAFFKDAWSVVGKDTTEAVLDFFSSGQLLKQLNHTLITLIPNRLSQILPDIISPNQGSFVKGRKIIENIMICQDLYLTRILNYITEELPFSYHPMCKQLKLTHLMFADDLLLFSKGNPQSIMVLLRGFSTFSQASGLEMNSCKSNAYFNGVNQAVKLDILKVSGFEEGKLPFKYLGVPITAGRISKSDVVVLVEKIVHKIRAFGAKKLSYAGRLTLVNSGVLCKVEAVCRNYLWAGSFEYLKAPYVA